MYLDMVYIPGDGHHTGQGGSEALQDEGKFLPAHTSIGYNLKIIAEHTYAW